jgi:hypothetical protein
MRKNKIGGLGRDGAQAGRESGGRGGGGVVITGIFGLFYNNLWDYLQ